MEKSIVSKGIRYNKDFKETNLSKYQERIKFKEYIKCRIIEEDYKKILEAITEIYIKSENKVFMNNFEKLIDEVINKNKTDKKELKEIGLIFDGINKLRIEFKIKEKESVIIQIKEGKIDDCEIETNKMIEIMKSLVSKYEDNKHLTNYEIKEAYGSCNIKMLLENVKIKINKINDKSSIKNDKIKIFNDNRYIIIKLDDEMEEMGEKDVDYT
jgi:hypothetical protein